MARHRRFTASSCLIQVQEFQTGKSLAVSLMARVILFTLNQRRRNFIGAIVATTGNFPARRPISGSPPYTAASCLFLQ